MLSVDLVSRSEVLYRTGGCACRPWTLSPGVRCCTGPGDVRVVRGPVSGWDDRSDQWTRVLGSVSDNDSLPAPTEFSRPVYLCSLTSVPVYYLYFTFVYVSNVRQSWRLEALCQSPSLQLPSPIGACLRYCLDQFH